VVFLFNNFERLKNFTMALIRPDDEYTFSAKIDTIGTVASLLRSIAFSEVEKIPLLSCISIGGVNNNFNALIPESKLVHK
jgi:hypothetical protein